jgi:hypothetical protein
MVDARTGNIYHPPIAYKGDDFYLPNLSYPYVRIPASMARMA